MRRPHYKKRTLSLLIVLAVCTFSSVKAAAKPEISSSIRFCVSDVSFDLSLAEKTELLQLLTEEASSQCESGSAQVIEETFTYQTSMAWGGENCSLYKHAKGSSHYNCLSLEEAETGFSRGVQDNDFCSEGCDSICKVDPWFCTVCRRICE